MPLRSAPRLRGGPGDNKRFSKFQIYLWFDLMMSCYISWWRLAINFAMTWVTKQHQLHTFIIFYEWTYPGTSIQTLMRSYKTKCKGKRYTTTPRHISIKSCKRAEHKWRSNFSSKTGKPLFIVRLNSNAVLQVVYCTSKFKCWFCCNCFKNCICDYCIR